MFQTWQRQPRIGIHFSLRPTAGARQFYWHSCSRGIYKGEEGATSSCEGELGSLLSCHGGAWSTSLHRQKILHQGIQNVRGSGEYRQHQNDRTGYNPKCPSKKHAPCNCTKSSMCSSFCVGQDTYCMTLKFNNF